MPHTIQKITSWLQGDSKRLEFSVTEDGDKFDITSADVDWWLTVNAGEEKTSATLSDDDSGVTIDITDASSGRVDVTVSQGTTDGIVGMYWQYIRVDTPDNSRQTWRGPVEIEE